MSSSVEEFDKRRHTLEQNIKASKDLIAELERTYKASTSETERGRLEVNIEDAKRQLNDWQYELSGMTSGKE